MPEHQTPLITTISGGLVLAYVFGLLAHRLRIQPLVGYLLAGIVVGPFTPGFVAHLGLATELAEIGVILLMFGVGLHFSFRDLLSVAHIAVPGAMVYPPEPAPLLIYRTARSCARRGARRGSPP